MVQSTMWTAHKFKLDQTEEMVHSTFLSVVWLIRARIVRGVCPEPYANMIIMPNVHALHQDNRIHVRSSCAVYSVERRNV